MSSPTRTTFEVKISNELQQQSIWVKIAAELNYASHLQSSSHTNDTQHRYNKAAHDTTDANTRYNKKNRETSDYTDNKKENSSEIGVKLKASYAGVGASVDMSHKTSEATQNISKQDMKALDENKSSDFQNDKNLKEESMQNMNMNQSASSSVLTNKIIEPGLVRITSLQSLSIPVIVENESQVVYITVFVDDFNGKQLCIANQLQINRQHIKIVRNKMRNEISIVPESDINNNNNKYRKLLLKWGIPEYLCDAMKSCGWDNHKLWDEIQTEDLSKMGFKKGHCIKFQNGYGSLKALENIFDNKLNYKYLLKKWDLPSYISDNMRKYGWNNIKLWNQISDDDFKDMGFLKGHMLTFKHYVKSTNLQQEFKKIEEKILQNAMKYENESKRDDDDDKLLQKPIFKINENTISHKGFDIEFENVKENEFYVIEINNDDASKQTAMSPIKQTKCHHINGLKINTNYSIKVRAQNAYKTSDYSDIIRIKTKDEKWRNQYLPKIPSFDYNLKFHRIEFEEKEINKIKTTKYNIYNEQYYLEIAFIDNSYDEKEEKQQELDWIEVATLNKKQLIYSYSVNHQNIEKDIKVRIKSQNDWGLSYSQYTIIKSFKNNIIKQSFYQKQYGKSLSFLNDTKVKKTSDKPDYGSCLFGEIITNKMCNKYELHIKLVSTTWKNHICLGYATSMNDVKNWDYRFGDGDNKDTNSVGIEFYNSNDYINLYAKGKQTQIKSEGGIKPKEGDIIIFTFDFVSNTISLKLNDKLWIKSITLNNQKTIVPGICIDAKDDVLEIVKWKFYS